MAFSFSCPECDKVLKTANPIPAGKKVRCPSCEAIFIPTAASAAIKSSAPVKAAPRPAPRLNDEEESDRPRGKTNPNGVTARKPAPRPPVEDDEDEDRPPSKRRIQDDEDDYDNDRPNSKRRSQEEQEDDDYDRPKKKKKNKKKASSKMPLILAGAGAALLLAVLGVTAFVWPGFLLTKPGGGGQAKNNKGKQQIPPITPVANFAAYAPPNTNMVVNINMTAAKDTFGFDKIMDSLGAKEKEDPFTTQLIKDAELISVFANYGMQTQVVIAVQTAKPINKTNLNVELAPITKDGQHFYQRIIKGKEFGKEKIPDKKSSTEFLCLPHERLAILCIWSDAGMAQIMANAAKGGTPISADLISSLKSVDSAIFHGALQITADMKKELDNIESTYKQQLGSLKEVMAPLKRAKTMAFGYDVTNSLNLTVGLLCGSDADAGIVKTSVDNWVKNDFKKLADGLIAVVDLTGALPPGASETLNKLVDEFNKSFKVTQEGPQVTAFVEASEGTVQALKKMIPDSPPGGGKDKGGFPGFDKGGFPGKDKGGFPGFDKGGFPGKDKGGFPGGFQGDKGGFPGGFQGDKGGFPGGFQGDKGGFPGGFQGNQGGFPGKDKGGNPKPGGDKFAGSTWSGTEQLAGYGNLSFVFGQNNSVTMIDAKEQSVGTYSVQGATVTLEFPGKCSYQGTVIGNTMNGTGRDERNTWKFSVKKK